VAIAATIALPNGGAVDVPGRIDRLFPRADEVLFCDFKTGSPPSALEATPPAYLTQAALYRAALASIYPDRAVRAFLVWTEGPNVQELPSPLLDDALARVATAP
jgi:ATP-dependent helicase/nuclease subunit A